MSYIDDAYDISVASVAYCLAGDQDQIPDFLKSVLVSSILTSNNSLAEELTAAIKTGPRRRLKNMPRAFPLVRDLMLASPPSKDEDVNIQIQIATGTSANVYVYNKFPAETGYWPHTRTKMMELHPQYLYYFEEVLDYNPTTKMITVRYTPRPGQTGQPFTTTYHIPAYDPEGVYTVFYYRLGGQPNNPNSGEERVYAYRRGSGNAILENSVIIDIEVGAQHFPAVSVRAFNRPVTNHTAKQKRMFRELTGAKIEDIVQEVDDNENAADIDYGFVVQAVPLTGTKPAVQRYVFEYFRDIHLRSSADPNWFDDWLWQNEDWLRQYDEWQTYLNENDGTLEPVEPPNIWDFPIPSLQASTIEVAQNRDPLRPLEAPYPVRTGVKWRKTELTTGTGQSWANNKPGDIRIHYGTEFIDVVDPRGGVRQERMEALYVTKQHTANTWERVTIIGLIHSMQVYRNKGIATTPSEAFSTPSDETSPFLLPINVHVYSQLSSVDQTQLAMSSSYLVLNCLSVRKRKFYEKSWFKIVLVIAVVLATLASGGLGASGTGILGTNVAVGTALGMSGLAAVVAGAITNMVAAMIVTKLITAASVELLGEKIGFIVSAILSFMTVNVAAGMQGGASFSQSFLDMFNPLTMAYMSLSVANGVTLSMQHEAADYMRRAAEEIENYREESSAIRQQAAELFGTSDVYFDPRLLTDTSRHIVESMDGFLQRTLLTGMDVAEITNDAINLFPSLTTSTKLL